MRILFDRGSGYIKGTPAIFIDRDGVINRRRADDYVLDWSQFVFVPGIRNALRALAALQLPMVVISNQAAVGKGLLTYSGLEEITSLMHKSLSTDGTTINAYYYCVHKSTDGCDCRKPRAGLLLRAADDFDVDLTRSIFVGDSETDVLAARSAGCEPVLFGAGVSQSANSMGWMTGVAVAPTAETLYQVVVESLRAIAPEAVSA